MAETMLEWLSSSDIEFKTVLDEDWGFYSSTYNVRVPATPEVVILPATIDEVSRSVLFAASFGLKVQARSGGHSYASHSNGGVDGAAVIDLRKFQDIVLDDDGIVRVGGGVRLGKLATTIFEQGGRALAHGHCPAVGVGGHFTHGGFGLMSRAWGLAMDQITKLQVVTADGRVVTASESENQELFMAMRGAADSFGIVVNFYLRTQLAPKSIVYLTIDDEQAMKSVGNAVAAFERLQKFVNNERFVDEGLGIVVFLAHCRFTLHGTYLGDVEDFASVILPGLLLEFPRDGAIKVELRQVDWPMLLRLMAGGADLDVSPRYAEHRMFFAKSATVSQPGLSREAIENYFGNLFQGGRAAVIGYFIGIQLLGGCGSRITANTTDDSFGHRDALWIFQHYGFVDDKVEFPEEGIWFVEDLNDALGPEHGASNNYADPSLKRDEALKLYYGVKLERLIELKARFDPQDVFCHPQSVRKLSVSGADVNEGGDGRMPTNGIRR